MSRNKTKIIKRCLNCNKEIILTPFYSTRKFCCLSCHFIYSQKTEGFTKGRTHTKEEKINIGKGVKKSRPKDWINPTTRLEVRAKISKTITELFKNPKNNPRYIDGRSGEKYPFEFNDDLKERIRKRDNYTCRDCDVHQEKYYRKLDIHHKDSNKHNLEESNLISLCESCHQKRHKKENLCKK